MAYIVGRGRNARETYPEPKGPGGGGGPTGPTGSQGTQGPTGPQGASLGTPMWSQSGTTGETNSVADFVLKSDADGTPIECNFTGNWAAGDVLVASFTAAIQQTGPGGVGSDFFVAVSLDGGSTWQALDCACSPIIFLDTTVNNSGSSGSGAIALASAPIVRIGNVNFISWHAGTGAHAAGFNLTCVRVPAALFIGSPSGTLIPI